MGVIGVPEYRRIPHQQVEYRKIPHRKNTGEILGHRIGRLGDEANLRGGNCNIPPKQAAEASRSSNLLFSSFQCPISYKFIRMERFISIRTWLLK